MLAAIEYFRRGSLILASTPNPWDLMSAVILYFSNSLEVMFGDRDGVRDGLRKIGLDSAEIEGDFIPILILRSKFDSAHSSIRVYPQQLLSEVYEYLSRLQLLIRNLLLYLLSEDSGDISRILKPQEENLKPDASELKSLEHLASTIANRKEKATTSYSRPGRHSNLVKAARK
jgi:hypothetical protein